MAPNGLAKEKSPYQLEWDHLIQAIRDDKPYNEVKRGVEASLVTTVWRGREKLHFINPVPLHEVYERWVRKFERQRLRLLHDLKNELEGE